MKVVVLGASGNAGVALLRALEAEPRVEEVVAVARRPPEDWSSSKTTWRALDIAADPLEPVVRGADVVVHLAWLIQPARDVAQCRAVNVIGSRRVMAAVAEARVPALVYASSVGAYSRGPKDRLVDESWPTGGVPTSFYSRHKVEVERLLDGFEIERPERPRGAPAPRPDLPARRGVGDPAPVRRTLPTQRARRAEMDPDRPAPSAAALPGGPRRRRRRRIPPRHRGRRRGAFNVAAEPILDGEALGRLLDARPVPVPAAALRASAAAAPST